MIIDNHMHIKVIKMHTVTLKDIMPAMSVEIVLANSCDPRNNKTKFLKFNPARAFYTVKFHDCHSLTSTSYKHPQDAIDKYNSIDA